MSVNIEAKKVVVERLKCEINNAQTIVLAEYRGVNVASMTRLRKQAREQNVYLKVLKNTLFKKAISGSSFENLSDKISGPLIYAISEDPINAAKVLHTFAKEDENIKITLGSNNGVILDLNQVIELASIPSKDELLAKLLAVIQYPVTGLVGAILALVNKKQEEFSVSTVSTQE